MNINLLDYKFNITSEHGENGILLTISRLLKNKNKVGVEIGASDGITSNNLYPFIYRNWDIYYIEGDKTFFNKLIKNTSEFKNVHRKFSFIKSGKELSNILEEFNIPKDFDIFSLDIDNIDYWVWKDLMYEPKIVCIEYNADLPEGNTVVKDMVIQRKDGSGFYGAHPYALAKLADKKGYDLVCITSTNMIFIRKEINIYDIINPYTVNYRKRCRPIKEEEYKFITKELEL